ncbi:MAG: hypothetical protein LBT04_02830 [Prevotellaceae bacterium]|jgi:hypothetical protein|nr:hypothetical protein [Prevotellaceae bacterium]
MTKNIKKLIITLVFLIKICIICAQNQSQAEIYFNEYRFNLAMELLEKQNDEKSVELLGRAKLGSKMLKSVENVVFVNSIVLNIDDLLTAYPQNAQIGFLLADTTQNAVCQALFGFLYGKKDRKIFAQCVDNQTDLYRSNNFLDGWDTPFKLSDKINTAQDENFPFMLSDGITLYFASKGHSGLGGYDIFMSRTNSEGEYLMPQNIGMPFNSPANDYLMVIDENSKSGWFASDRFLTKGKVAVYQFIYNEQKIILTDTNEDNLRQAAQKIVISHENSAKSNYEQQITVAQAKPIKNFYFILTDTIVYHDFSDFKKTEALQKFRQLQRLENDLFYNNMELNSCREYYRTAEPDQKEFWSKKILTYEKKQQELEKQIKTQTKDVRREELN